MTKEQLAPWIERLARANPKDRVAIVGEMCKENGLKAGDAWRLLKEAGFDSKATSPQGGTAPDNTGPVSGTAGAAQPSGNMPPANETKQCVENQGSPPTSERKPAKKRVRHEKLKGKKLIVGNKTIAFDADGIAELDAADAERLLTIPDYTEVPDA